MEFSFSEHIILRNQNALLRPLDKTDFKGLSLIAYNYDIWRSSVSRCMNDDELKIYIDTSLNERERNIRYPLVIIDSESGSIAGSSSFGNISNKDKRLEIGWSWLGKRFQGTGLNKSCKFLMLTYAFEHLDFERVEFKTDVLNAQSRRALEKIGAKEEGILRSHTVMHDGRRRDTIYYSILKPEWENIKYTHFSDLDLKL